jgi:hypothetical protein
MADRITHESTLLDYADQVYHLEHGRVTRMEAGSMAAAGQESA